MSAPQFQYCGGHGGLRMCCVCARFLLVTNVTLACRFAGQPTTTVRRDEVFGGIDRLRQAWYHWSDIPAPTGVMTRAAMEQTQLPFIRSIMGGVIAGLIMHVVLGAVRLGPAQAGLIRLLAELVAGNITALTILLASRSTTCARLGRRSHDLATTISAKLRRHSQTLFAARTAGRRGQLHRRRYIQ